MNADNAAGRAAREELARRRLLNFASCMDPNYVNARHISYLCGVLEALERGELKHLIVLVPPRHGKTRLVSQFFPAWWLGRHPADEVILTSNTAGLAEDNSAKVRNLLNDERYPFDARVSADTFAKDLWRTTSGSIVRAAGIGGAIQGRGIHLGVVDDPVAGAEDATDSAFERQWRWFSQDFFPRRLADSHVVLSMFRWGDRDLAGRILGHDDPDFRNEWTVVSLPAYACAGDPLEREPGDVLWPPSVTATGRRVGYDRAFLETQRKMDSRVWAAQYELDPVPAGGVMFKAEWLTQRYTVLPEFRKIIVAVDTAAKTAVKNDFSVAVVIGATKSAYYLLDVIRRKVEFPDLQRMVVGAYREHGASTVYVEDTSNGIALVQQLHRDSHIPVVPVKARSSKITRAEAITGIVESGKLILPNDAPWLVDFEKELLRFPNAAHDDQVDALTLGLEKARASQYGGFSFAIVSP